MNIINKMKMKMMTVEEALPVDVDVDVMMIEIHRLHRQSFQDRSTFLPHVPSRVRVTLDPNVLAKARVLEPRLDAAEAVRSVHDRYFETEANHQVRSD